MKKILSICLLGATVALMSACGGSKQVVDKDYYNNPRTNNKSKSSTTVDDGFVEVKLNDAELYAEEKPGQRAVGSATHFKESVASQLAEANARGSMSDALTAAIISASKQAGVSLEKYAGGTDDSELAVDGAYQTNNMVRSISRNAVSGAVRAKKVKSYNANTRQWKVYVCMEYVGDLKELVKNTVKDVKNRISDEDRLKIEYDLKKFEDEVYNSFTNSNQ